jgi:dihydroflavonol-4-reductase
MRVMVTGGTGFVGAHTVAELARAGHTLRLLVRAPERVRRALEPLGVEEVDIVGGDVTDPAAVQRALDGCDAVVHAASVFSFDPRMSGLIARTNVRGTDLVLGLGQRLGLDPIVHVSSFVALIGTERAVLAPDSPVTSPPGTYNRSKADSDRVARGYQETGAPVVIAYPGSVWGPYDPHFGESCQLVRNILRRFWTFAPAGMIPITDVRDLAKLHAAVLEPGRGPRRYMATAQNVPPRDVIRSVERVTGHRLPMIELPPWTLQGPARLADALQPRLPARLPVSGEALYIVGRCHRLDDGTTRRDFGLVPRDLDETVAETIRWMARTGQLPARLAGGLAA